MAKMNDEQQALLTQLEEARVVYDKFTEDLRKEVSDRKWEKQARIRDLVRKAREKDVPYARIGVALETADHYTLKRYEKDVRRDT